MDNFQQSLMTQPSAASVAPETLEMLGRKAASMFLQQDIPLNDGISQLIAEQPGLNNEHVRRIIEFANNTAFQELFQSSPDKNVHFDVADPGVVIRDMKDGGSPAHDGKTLSEGKKDFVAPPRAQGDMGDEELSQAFAPGQSPSDSMSKMAYVGVDDIAGGAIGYNRGKAQKKRGEDYTVGGKQLASLILPGGATYQLGRAAGHGVFNKKNEKAKTASMPKLAAERSWEPKARAMMLGTGIGAAAGGLLGHKVISKNDPHRKAKGVAMGLGGAGLGATIAHLAKAKFAEVEEMFEVPHATHNDPIDDIYDVHLHLQATRDDLTTRNDAAEMMLKMAKDDFYSAVKAEVIDWEGAGLGGVVAALEKVATQSKLAKVIPSIIQRLVRDGVAPQQLEQSLEKLAGVVVNQEHPLIVSWREMEKAAQERALLDTALKEVDMSITESHNFLRQAR